MTDDAEKGVSEFYSTIRWETELGITEDARRFEDLRECAREYVSKCRRRLLKHIPGVGENILDMASGPIQYEEYLEYSRHYKKRYCVDLSPKALQAAREKIGDHGVFLSGSFFDIQFEEDFFDCAISLHTIYHIDKEKQEAAVRKLISVTKYGKPVIIVYSNPNILIRYPGAPRRVIRKMLTLLRKTKRENGTEPGFYFFSYPIKWWNRFSDVADIQILPWRSFSSGHQKAIIPDNKIGKKLFDILFNLEERVPSFFVKHCQYPLIILTKK